MNNEDVSSVEVEPEDTLQGQPWLRVGYICAVVTWLFILSTKPGAEMFDNSALNFAIVMGAVISGIFLAASVRGGSRLGTELTWVTVALMAATAAAFLIVPLVR
jgi:hypothetical protein